MYAYFMVFIGGGLGSICRYGIAHALYAWRLNFPLATLLANVLSCLLLGFLMGVSLQGGLGSQHHRLLLMTGFCGGFSTFSTFSNETFLLFNEGHYGLGLANIGLSLLICLACIFGGVKLAYWGDSSF